MTCVNCGAFLAPNAKFCDNCGRTLSGGVRGPTSIPPLTDQTLPTSSPSVVVVRNPGLALLLSIFFPGAGQIYNGEIGKGILMFLGYVMCLALMALVVPIFGAIGIWLWSLIDAYQNAKTSLVQR